MPIWNDARKTRANSDIAHVFKTQKENPGTRSGIYVPGFEGETASGIGMAITDAGGILMNSTLSGGFAPDRYAEPQQVDYSRISPNSDDFTVNQKCSPFFALYNSAEHFGTTGLSGISSVRHIPSSS